MENIHFVSSYEGVKLALFEKNKSEKKEDIPNEKIMNHPRVLLIDMDTDLYDSLKKKGFNVKKGTLGKKYKTSTKSEEVQFTHYLPNLVEQDVIVIDPSVPSLESLSNSDVLEEESSANRTVWVSPQGQNYFDPRPLIGGVFSSSFYKILEVGGIIITFASYKYDEQFYTLQENHGVIDPYSLEDNKYNNFDFLNHATVFSENNRRSDIFLEHSVFERTLKRYQEGLRSELTFNLKETDFVLAKDRFGKAVAFVRLISVEENLAGLLIVLPLSSKRNEILIELMTEVLPSIHPNIFPDIANFRWINKEDYMMPSIKKLVNDKKITEEKFENKIKEIEDKIQTKKQNYNFLYGILLPDSFDDKLVKNLAKIFSRIGYNNVICPDDHIKGNKQEDLQIRHNINQKPILIEAKGISGKPSEKDCQQVLKYIIRRQREEKRDMHGIFIVNNQRNIEPLERDNPFTKAQIDDAENSHYSLLSTWTLFKAFISFERGELNFEDIDYCLSQPGLIKFLPKDWKQIGQVVRIFPEQNVIGIKIDENKLAVGDYIGFIQDDRYLTKKIESMEVDGNKVSEGYPNQDIGIKINAPVDKKFNKTIIYKVNRGNSQSQKNKT